MLILSVLLLALAAAAVAATLVELRRDGFRRVPTDRNRVHRDAAPRARSPRRSIRSASRVARHAPSPQHAR